MKPKQIKTILTALLAAGLICSAAQAQVLATWSADADSTIDGTWADSSTNSNDLAFGGVPETRVAVSGQSFSHAYSFGDVGSSTNALRTPSWFQNVNTIPAGDMLQLDVWFNPDNATQRATLFSDGGTSQGYSVNYDEGTLRLLLKDGTSSFNLASDTPAAAGVWSKVTVQIDQATNPTSRVTLLLNDVVVASDGTKTIGDFTGANHTAIANDNSSQLGGGAFNGVNNDGSLYYGAFTGDIALVELAIVPAGDAPAGAPAEPHPDYPYWPGYYQAADEEIVPQNWIGTDHSIEGWDWSLPPGVTPSPKSLMGIERKIGLGDVPVLSPAFPVNAAFIQWVYWRELEPVEGEINWQPLLDRIEQCRLLDQKIIIRILAHSQSKDADLTLGHAPRWLEDKGIAMLETEAAGTGVVWENYNPEDPVFHAYYLNLINSLQTSGIPQMDTVRAMYVGYASTSLGDEGIGPEGMDPANEPQHVKERLDAWDAAASNVQYKIFMGDPSEYGFAKGFGVRRGFVEKYLYTIPDDYIGQQVDTNGYLYVDETAPVIQSNVFNGEVNEEYEEYWATAESGYRFGTNTASFSYRYFMSNLRLVQMRCTYVHNKDTLITNLLPWVSQQLGRTVEDTPEVWSYLNTSYLNSYPELKNFERWLYQRDTPGYETTPAVPISNEPVKLTMVQTDKQYDHMAKRGQNFGFAIDDRFISSEPTPVAVKVSYLDQTSGTLTLNYSTPDGPGQKSVDLIQDGKLKTATFVINDLIAPAEGFDYDLTFSAPGEAVLSFVRIIKLTYPEDYSDFALRYGLTGGPTGDDDGNGVSNFAEYAFGGNPLDRDDPGRKVSISIHGNEIAFNHVWRRESSLSPNYWFEWSNDLLLWQTAGLPVPQTQAIDDVFDEVSIVLPLSLSETSPLYLRSIAEQ